MNEQEIKEAEIAAEDVAEGGLETRETSETISKKNDMLAVIILLAGLLAGSLFVDVAQLVTAQGFSDRALRQGDVLERNGKTWVAYSEPAIHMQVLSDKTCENCDVSEALLFLRQYIPTMVPKEVDIATQEGKDLAQKIGAKSIPAFAFDGNIEKTDFYTQAQSILEKKDALYTLNTQAMGVPAGKYLELPSVSDGDITFGNKDAKVRIIEFSDFQCPYCEAMYPVMEQAFKEYGDKVEFVFKQFPLSIHPQAQNAALASECANDQGKFKEYYDTLFTKQEAWSQTTGTAAFKQYARNLRLDAQQFNTCMDSQKHKDKITADMEEGQAFGVSGTPAFFIGGEFLGGAAQYEEVKVMIDRQLEEANRASGDNTQTIDENGNKA